MTTPWRSASASFNRCSRANDLGGNTVASPRYCRAFPDHRSGGADRARIGRGYDNDVIIDDPYVAAQHLRVFRDEAGQLVAEDLGSANGTFLDGGRNRFARIVIDGKHPIRIGQTYLRVRDIHHEVERERVAPPEWRALPIAAAAALGASLLGLSALQVWLAQTAELRASSYLTPLLTIVATVLVWAGI